MSTDDTGIFRLWLPVFKQGDDFRNCLDRTGNPAEAFKALADTYADASRRLRRVAGMVLENPGFDADGDCHAIYLDGPTQAAIPLVQEGILEEEAFDEEEEMEPEEVTETNICTNSTVDKNRCVLSQVEPPNMFLTGWYTSRPVRGELTKSALAAVPEELDPSKDGS